MSNKLVISKEELEKYYAEGLTQKEIAYKYNCVEATIRRISRSYGISRHKKLTYKIGDRYGSRVIIDDAPSGAHNSTKVKVRCDCGSIDVVSLSKLVNGNSWECKKCNVKHNFSARPNLGITTMPWYTVWESMFTRCYNPNCKHYHDYGGRGIKVCDEWKNSFVFGEWALTHGYQKGLQLDRINNNGNYCPENCRWVTSQVNNNNRRSNVIITIDNITDTLANTCRRYGLSPTNVISYAKRHDLSYTETIIAYLDNKVKTEGIKISFNGETHTIVQWASKLGMNKATLYSRYRKGYSVADVLYKGNLWVKQAQERAF